MTDCVAEDVADQAGGAVIVEMPAVEGDDAGGLLAAMLQGVQAERGVGGGIGSAVDAEQRTLLVKLVEVVVEAFGGTGTAGLYLGTAGRAIKDISLRRFGHVSAVWAGRPATARSPAMGRESAGVVLPRPDRRVRKPGGRYGSTKLAISLIIGKVAPPSTAGGRAAARDSRRTGRPCRSPPRRTARRSPRPGCGRACRAAPDRTERDSALVSITSTIRAATKTASMARK